MTSGPGHTNPSISSAASPKADSGRRGPVRVYAYRGPGDDAMSDRLAQNWWAIALRGVAAIVFGILALIWPGAVMVTFALLFAAYLLVDGVFAIVAAVRAAQRNERWGLLLAEGILDIIMGIIAALFPVSAVLAFVLITAAWALLTGGLMVGAAFRLNPQHGRGWMVLGGVVSIIWGILLVIAPLVGAVVLTWWMGGYAIAFGIMLLVLAFKLKGQKDRTTSSGTAVPQT